MGPRGFPSCPGAPSPLLSDFYFPLATGLPQAGSHEVALQREPHARQAEQDCRSCGLASCLSANLRRSLRIVLARIRGGRCCDAQASGALGRLLVLLTGSVVRALPSLASCKNHKTRQRNSLLISNQDTAMCRACCSSPGPCSPARSSHARSPPRRGAHSSSP
jgi:hypothetical protein